ncbi:TPA: YadA-like family protein [Pasteurella multocida]|uniref:YadA-like family protein n=1 Tax=Pasteurella multocida TaxID=747 RepID=UPI00202023F5|nr:YadA-like family protein [Pasteurella multocida]MCL7801881.1 YadA-like family protein [Pasteurella multocida]MDG2541044.1 YadA-like family protein [Pasteurella multocida]URH96968.1 YadA-like family protein [Pasteurella multocida]HDR0673064.1 YadA-like family protein [Pasteurella multocida]HDR0675044.1 YadA-like family protein [Pasteurella multocida]
MNKVYRVIWSHVTNTFIAVSELATSKGKVKSFSAISSNPQSELNSSIPATFKLSAIALVSILAFAPSQVLAQDVNATNLTVSGTSTFTGKAKFGEVEATSLNVNGQAVATANDVTTAVVGKVDQGEFNTLKNTVDGKVNQGEFNTLKSTVDGKVNQGEFNTLKSTVDGKVNQGEFNTLKNTVDSKASKTELTNLSNLVAQLGLTAGGEYTGLKYFRTKSNLADATATGTDAIAIGPESKATSANTIAMGHSASATKQKSVAIGFHANTKSEQSIALGEAAKAEKNADKGIAIGSDARVGSKENGDVTYDGASSYVVGSGDGKSSIAIGDNAVSRGTANIAIGKSAINSNKDLDGQFSNNSIAVGTDAQTIASNNAIALGNMAKVNKSSDSSIAIGDQAQTLAINALALGKTSQAKGESSVAVGLNAQSESERTIAIGTNSKAQQGDVIALGTGANALPSKTISIGLNAGLNQVTDVAETKHSHINIGENAGEGVNGQFNIGIGKDAGKYVIGKANIAIGLNAGTHLANTEETVGDNVSIGNFANKYDVKTPIQRSTAIGAHTKTASDSTALGYQAQATALKSTAIGFASKALGEQAVAIGSSAEADSNNVALGSNSKAKAKAGTGYLTGTDSSLVVSVGHQEGSSNQHILRRLVNVADGADDQDAVTVSQLKKVTEKVTTDLQAKFNALNHSPTASEIKYDTVPPDAATGAENKITLKPKTRISNVANAESDTDAVNLKQVNQIINDKKAHYFSVNDQGLSSVPGNHDNDAATGKLSMAIGQNVIAKAERSIAIGNNANAHGEGSIALGTLYQGSDELDDGNAKNSATNATVSNQPYKYGLAIGAGANTEGNNSIAIGSLAASSNKDIQGGNVDRAIAIGYFARTSGEKSTAIGERSVASGVRANAMGSQAQATAESSTAIGTKANANAKNSIAFGTHQKVTGVNSGSIGYAGEEGDAPELKKVKTIVSGTGTYSLGNTNGTVTANESGIFGNNNIISAKENTRLVGNKNVIGDITVEPSASNPGGVAPKNELKDIYVTGYSNKISSNKKLAKDLSGLFVYGHTNTIADIADPDSTEEIEITNSSVIGANNTLNTKGSDFFVLGNNVNATLGNSVYLGKESAYVGAGNSTSGMEVYTDIAGGLNQSGHSFAGGTPVGVVTVGAVGKERRVQNVASGLVSETSTDAINGSQLFALTRPLRFAGDNSTLTNQDGKPTNDANVVSRSSNQAIDITGGETDTNKLTAKTDKNIGVIVTDNNSMEIRLAKTLTNLAEANFGTGNDKTTINKDGVTIFNNGKGNVSLTDAGLDNGNNKIVNVAEGTADTDAVNVKQLKDLKAEGFGLVAEDGQDVKQALGTAIKVTGDDNVKTKIVTDTDGSKKLEIGLENQVTLGGLAKNGNPAADGKLTLKNQAGTDKVVLDGANGSVGLTGADGAQATITVKNGSPAVDGTANTTKPRITYGNEEVATLNDGLKFGANDGTVHNAKLNTQVDVKGKAENTQWTDFDAGQNIMTQIKDNTITVALAKALSGLTSATFGDPAGNPKDGAVINKDGLTITQGDNTVSLTENGLDNGNKQIKNVASGLTKADGTATDLANAVGTNGVNVNDLKNVVNGNDDQGAPNTTGGFGLKDKAGQIFKQNLGETAQITGDSNVNTKVVDGQNGGKALEVSLANQLTLGKGPEGANAGEAGKITLKDDKGTDRVVVDGSEGAISLTGQPATQGGTAPTAKIKVGMGNADLESSPNDSTVPAKNKTRITYDITGPNGTTTEELATLNDGLKFGANTGDVHNAKLNSRVDVKGKADNTNWANFDAGQNIMTQIQGNTITVALAKALKDLTSASFVGGTDNTSSVLNGNGLTITKKADAQDPNAKDTVVSLTEKGLDNGGNQIVNVASGLKNKDGDAVALKDATGDVLNNGVNVGDLKDAITNITSAANGGFGLKDKDGAEFKQDLGTTAQITGDDNINTKVIDGKNGGKALEVSLADNITLGKPTKDGVEGKDASVTVAGKDGASVVLNGKDGSIGLTGPKGADGKSVSADMKVQEGKPGVDGKAGETKTRIVYTPKDKDGNPVLDDAGKPVVEEVATLNDGMKFVGNDGKEVTRKLNETLDIKGGLDAATVADNAKVSSSNLGVKTNAEGTGLEIVMKERPTFSGLVVNGKDGEDAAVKFAKDGKDGMSIAAVTDNDGNATGLTIKDKDGNPGVTFNNDGRITNVTAGVDDKDAVNVSQLKDGLAKATTKVEAGKNMTVTPTVNQDGSTTYTVATEDNVNFTTVTTGNTVMNNDGVKVGDNVALTNEGLKAGDVTVTTAGINAGNKKVTGVADGDISPNSTDAVNGSQLNAVKETAEAGWHLTANGADSSNVKPRNTVDLNNTDGNIVISKTNTADSHNVTFGLADNINVKDSVVVGPKGADGKPGEGAVVINAKDGANGKDGISIVGKDGKDAVAISGKDGVGTIGLTGPAGADGKNANAIIGVKDSVKGLDGNDGKDGNSKTRIVYTKPNGEEEQVATMNDGLVFGADKGTEHKAKLGTTVKVKGDDKNIETEVAGDTIRVRLKDNIDVKGINVTENLTVKEGAKINMGNNVIDGVADGEVSATSKQAVNGSQLHKVQQQVNNQATAINKLGDHINKVDKDLRAGIAGATAVAFLQRPNEAGKSIVSLGVGSYRSESAIAVGYARNSDNNKISIKLGGGMNSRGDVNFGGSIGYQW